VTVVTFNINLEHNPIPLPDASLDLVLCCEVIEHMDVDPMFLLAEINRVVKPGGHLFITTPNIASARGVWKILNGYAPHFFTQYMKDRSPYRHNYEHDIHSLQSLTRAAGFATRMLKTLDVFEEPEPRALFALDRLGMPTEFRGDDIFLLGQKLGPVVDRWPPTIYV
jgi:ubiquinone/menaquinone biosynthesis C-methylase UbiE